MEITCKQINCNNYNVKYLDIAKNEALKSELTNKHGCVIVRKNKVIAKGYNKYNNEFKHCFSIHAEMDVINKCRKLNLSDCKLFVIRINSLGEFKNSKPCECCQKVIRKKKIKRIFHS